MNIKRNSGYLAAGFLLVSLAGCKNLLETAQEKKYIEPAGVTLMTETEIRNTVVGNTYKGESVRYPGSTYIEYIHPDGRISGLWNGTDRYKGKWAVAGPVWCYRYETQRGCNTLVKSGDRILWYHLDGSHGGGEALVMAGDPENLSQ